MSAPVTTSGLHELGELALQGDVVAHVELFDGGAGDTLENRNKTELSLRFIGRYSLRGEHIGHNRASNAERGNLRSIVIDGGGECDIDRVHTKLAPFELLIRLIFSGFSHRNALRASTTSVVIFTVLCFSWSAAWSQVPEPDTAIEYAAKRIAIEAVANNYNLLRWLPSRFPIKTKLVVGSSLSQTPCWSYSHREFNDYVRFLNATEALIDVSKPLDQSQAIIFAGGFGEFTQSSPYRLQNTWASLPGMEILYRVHDRQGNSYLRAYGKEANVQYSIRFDELSADLWQSSTNCESTGLSGNASTILLQEYAYSVRNRALRISGGKADRTLTWRADRRLLSAMRTLSQINVSSSDLRAAFIEAVSNQ